MANITPLPHIEENDKKRLHDFYETALTEFGDADARSLHWSDARNQRIRFDVLLGIGDIHNKSILDVGCGLGDLYKYLLKRCIEVDYTGIDIMPEFTAHAAARYPEGKFLTGNILEHNFDNNKIFDYVLASGALSFKIQNHQAYYFSCIKKMFDLATIGVAFNMLNRATHIDDADFAAYDPSSVAGFCKTFCDRVEIVTDYLPQDFTIYMYK